MADIRILSGFTTDVPISTRSGFWFGLGSSNARVYLSSMGARPVAVRKRLLMPGDVTLAYRLLGLKCPAETAGLASALVFIALGLMGIANLAVFPHSTGATAMFYVGIALGGLSVYRLREIVRAKRILSNWEPSPPP